MESNTAARDVEILGLTSDSREVRPGYLFAAIKGSRADGGDFIGDALARGAAAVLGPPGTRVPESMIEPGSRPVPVIADDNPRRRLALMAARFFAPSPPPSRR